jgi:hypothetical protein
MNRVWFWCGLLLGLDSLLGLLGGRYWKTWLPGWPIQRIATIEAIVAIVCIFVFMILPP